MLAAAAPFSSCSADAERTRYPGCRRRTRERLQPPVMIALLTDPQSWIAFATLTALELVLGIDNIIFISILVDKLPPKRRELARKAGLFMAMFMRVALLMLLA